MKGIIFREFLEMAESKFGYELVDEILLTTSLESKGIYTSTGIYEHTELYVLENAVSEKTGIPLQQLFVLFGNHVFSVFTHSFGHLISAYNDPFQFLISIENTIHVEVLKLYPEAELPSFKTEMKNEDEMVMIYKSSRKMADFAEGLIIGCFDYFKIGVTIKKQMLTHDLTLVKFKIKRNII
jgi:hypothetical protein